MRPSFEDASVFCIARRAGTSGRVQIPNSIKKVINLFMIDSSLTSSELIVELNAPAIMSNQKAITN
jgi:hypothetical protein